MEKINTSRRDALAKLVQGSAFAVPVVATFAMAVSAPTTAMAQSNTPVPTLTDWALPGLGVLLGAAAIAAQRKTGKE